MEGVCERAIMTYAEGAPSVYGTIGSDGKGGTVTRGNLRHGGALGKVRHVDGGRGGLLWIQPIVVRILVRILFRSVDVLKTTLPFGVSTEGTLIVDTPGQDLIVVGQRGHVHAADGDLHNSDLVR